MEIQNYLGINIKVLQHNNLKKVRTACDITQKKKPAILKPLSRKTAKHLIKADHTSVFEHTSATFLASGISRSLLAQITRERHFSFTSGSQHYQKYGEYPMSLRPGYNSNSEIGYIYKQALENSLRAYLKLIELGEKIEEARQVLPNACTVTLLITANVRALIHFLRTRLCERNVLEMQVFAQDLHRECINLWPEVFNYIDMPCIETGKCNQGKMSCGRKI